MSKKIIGVLGLGIFGKTVAEELCTFDQEVIALDYHEDHVQAVANTVTRAAVGDITNYEFLESVGIEHCDTVVIATGNSLEASVLAVMHCKKLGVQNIIAKAKSGIFEDVLYNIGASRVIMPERASGKSLASHILRRHISNIIHVEDDISIIEFKIPQKWVGKNLIELDVRNKYELNVVGIRRGNMESLTTDFNAQEPLPDNIQISAVTNSRTFEKFDYLGYLK
ncbi:potassium channel family protein [Streptococcus thoraltensis]|uniref:potassium channel family protein n=1 Tax=Streptococcus thoraltensis TaxID=55085 RepID=UPI00038248BF|nr:TrkA family potassium uptake protein [Streptococcus thoraltensis]MDY4761855.1 TrkA family potassium uptake protein [Streptococcus thoraltensis]